MPCTKQVLNKRGSMNCESARPELPEGGGVQRGQECTAGTFCLDPTHSWLRPPHLGNLGPTTTRRCLEPGPLSIPLSLPSHVPPGRCYLGDVGLRLLALAVTLRLVGPSPCTWYSST